jgi:DNA helicase II / ATP-dependent DNA helicase PcrA
VERRFDKVDLAASGSGSSTVIRPSKPNASKPSFSSGPIYKKGDRVRHGKFGDGVIVQVFGEGPKTIYNVQFDTVEGKKLINPKFAPLDLI